MQWIKKTLEKWSGFYYPQEYLCFAKEKFEAPLHAYLLAGNRVMREITNAHVFAGYNPLVLVVPVAATEPVPQQDIIFMLSSMSLVPNEIPGKKDAIAKISLRLIRVQKAGETSLLYFEGTRGEHHFTNSLRRGLFGLSNRLFNRKKDNVFLHGDLYRQVQIAYALPREIALVTVSDGHHFNCFPTDLHGTINDDYYIDSLRHQGRACQQVLDNGKILLSSVDAGMYRTAYSLGKNHMKAPGRKEDFPFGDEISPRFGLPVPRGAIYCRELELTDHFTHGIHRMLLFKTRSAQSYLPLTGTLAHIHNLYASWRHKKGLPGNYLLR